MDSEVKHISPESPEARRRGVGGRLRRRLSDLGFSERFFEVTKRVAVGTYTDGFTYAGNLAYLSLVTLFPFFIVAAAIARLLGQSGEGVQTLNAFLQTVPPDVANALRQPVQDVLEARSGNLLWLGALVGLWTVAGLIETLRGILRRAYGTTMNAPFWEYRLGSIGLIIAAVVMAMLSFSVQFILVGVQEFINRVLPFSGNAAQIVSVTRIAPAVVMFGALYMLFYSLTPSGYRHCPKWPGALLVTGWWLATTTLLPRVIGMVGNYDLTYGSLAGVMIALIFFFIIGLGMVIGAELNAALAEEPDDALDDAQQEKEQVG